MTNDMNHVRGRFFVLVYSYVINMIGSGYTFWNVNDFTSSLIPYTRSIFLNLYFVSSLVNSDNG